MSRRRLRAAAIALGLVTALSCRWAAYNLVLSTLILPWLLGQASARRALMRRARSLGPLLFGMCLSMALFAAMSDETMHTFWQRVSPLAARLLAASLLLSWLTHDLRAAQLQAALRALRLPASLIALVMQTCAFARQLSETSQAAWAACALRGGLSSPRALRHSVGAVAGVLVLRSVDRSERVALAAVLRAVDMRDGPAQVGPLPPDRA